MHLDSHESNSNVEVILYLMKNKCYFFQFLQFGKTKIRLLSDRDKAKLFIEIFFMMDNQIKHNHKIIN